MRPLITHEFALDDAAQAYDTIFDPAAGSLAVLLRYPAAALPDPVAAFAPRAQGGNPGRRRAPKEKIEFALVGAGNLAKWEHLPNLKKLPGRGPARRVLGGRRARQELRAALRRRLRLHRNTKRCCATRRWTPC